MDKLKYKEILNRYITKKHRTKFLLRHVVTDASLIITILILFSTKICILNLILIPVLMFRQFALLHEGVHFLIHPNYRINNTVSSLAGFICLTPFNVWKKAHLKHHYFTGNIEQDPTFSILKRHKQYSLFKKNLIEFTWKHGIPLLAFFQHLEFWFMNWQESSTKKRVLSTLAPIIYSMFFLQLNFIGMIVCITAVLIYFRLYEEMIIPQHVGLSPFENSQNQTPAWKQELITRTWYLPNLIERYLVLNMNYHSEHHLFSNLPWYELKNVHEDLLKNSIVLQRMPQRWLTNQRQKPFTELINPIKSEDKMVS